MREELEAITEAASSPPGSVAGCSIYRTLIRSFLYLSCMSMLISCTEPDRVDNRNFAVVAYSPSSQEIGLAQQRAQRYWARHSQKFQNSTKYLAVNTTSVLQADIAQNIYPELINSQTTGSFFGKGDSSVLNASCIMIFDTATNRFVSNSGYVSIDLPPLESTARWGNYMARYIGWGS